MQKTNPFESVSKVEMILEDGSRRGVMAHTACATRKGLVQLSVPTPADPVSDAYEVETERCGVCKRKLWKETEDGEGVQHAQATGEEGQEGEEGRRGVQVPTAQGGAPLHGLERTTVPEYRAKAIHIDAEQIIGRDVNVSTRRGLITARNGDWIIHDALGVAEVLDGDAFFKRYEMVPEEALAPVVEPGTPDPNTPRDAPREEVQFPEHLQSYLTGESGMPGQEDLTEKETHEAAKEPGEMPVSGSTVEIPVQDPKNKGGRPPKSSYGH